MRFPRSGAGAPLTKVGFMSLGCPKNLVDSEVMLGHLRLRGYQITSVVEEAQVLVVNTCGFIDAAKQESIEAILQAAAMKQQMISGTSCRAKGSDLLLVMLVPPMNG